MTGSRRAIALWLLLFAVYAGTVAIDARDGSAYAGDEPHVLLTAESIVSDGDVDVTDQYRERAWADWYPSTLRPAARAVDGRLHEPQGIGLPLLIAPAYELGGPLAVQLFLAALAALAFVLAWRLAGRLVPDPWATAAVLVVALSPPALAAATAVSPELLAGGVLAGIALCALRARDEAGERVRRTALIGGGLTALLPWLGASLVLAGAVVVAALVRSTHLRGRRIAAIVAAELPIASLVFSLTINERLYGGPLPASARPGDEPLTGAEGFGGYLERIQRLAALWLDRDSGLVRWAPILLLVALAGWLLWRSRRDRLARAIDAQRDVDAAAAVLLCACVAHVLLVAFAAPTLEGGWFAGRRLVALLPLMAPLTAWGLRRVPRTGAALAALTLVAGAWLCGALALGELDGWVLSHPPPGTAPWGPVDALLPRYSDGSTYAAIVTGLLLGALALVAGREWWRWRDASAATAAARRRPAQR